MIFNSNTTMNSLLRRLFLKVLYSVLFTFTAENIFDNLGFVLLLLLKQQLGKQQPKKPRQQGLQLQFLHIRLRLTHAQMTAHSQSLEMIVPRFVLCFVHGVVKK